MSGNAWRREYTQIGKEVGLHHREEVITNQMTRSLRLETRRISEPATANTASAGVSVNTRHPAPTMVASPSVTPSLSVELTPKKL